MARVNQLFPDSTSKPPPMRGSRILTICLCPAAFLVLLGCLPLLILSGLFCWLACICLTHAAGEGPLVLKMGISRKAG